MERKPRLLVLASTYPRWQGDSEPGFVHELSRRLTDSFEVTVVCPAASGAPLREVMDGVQIRRFRYAPDRFQILVNDGGIVTNLKNARWKWSLVPLFLIAQFWSTREAIKELDPDVVHAHWLIPQGLAMALLAKFSRGAPPFLVTSHGADLHALRFWPMPSIKRFVARAAAALTVVSSSMLAKLQSLRIDSRSVYVEPMGVDLQHTFVPGDSIGRSNWELLFVGRLVEKKGVRYLIEAMPRILTRHPEVHLTVAGFGPEKAALEALARAVGVADRVAFLGAVRQDQLPALYRRAAVFVAPFIEATDGDQEGLGLVTVEAVGCECPVIVTDLPAVEDLITEPGLRVPPARPDLLALEVINTLDSPPSSRKAAAKALRHRLFQRLDWTSRAMAYECVLRRAMNRNTPLPQHPR